MVVGLVCSVQIGWTAPVGGGRKASWLFVRDVIKPLRQTWGPVPDAVCVASAYFLFCGAFLKMNLIPYGVQARWDQIRSGYLFVPAAVGIGLGSWLAGRLSGRSIEFGIVPLGALGLAGCCIAAAFMGDPRFWHIMLALMFLAGVSSGMFIVPLNAFIQFRSPATIRGEVIAASAFLSWVGVLLAAGLLFLLETSGASAAQSFSSSAADAGGAGGDVGAADFLVRFVLVVLTRFIYRCVVAENVPTEGGVLLVSNHMSWVDAAFLGARRSGG